MKRTTYILMGLVIATFALPVIGIIGFKNVALEYKDQYNHVEHYNCEIIIDQDTILTDDFQP